jgi:hypothetical protein
MKKNNYFIGLLTIMMAVTICLGFTSCGDDDGDSSSISVSPTSVSLLSDKGSTSSITVTASGEWSLTNCPEWLHVSATSGTGTTTLILTALTENWSAESRSAVLSFISGGNTASATISQLPSMPAGLKVTTSNMTIMSDGFACDLKFGTETKGYREAFFTEDAIKTMTERDIYNKLMEQTEYSGSADYTFLPTWVNPGTKLVYCVAAYGNENNTDGSHKYGPMTMVKIETKDMTIYDDMYLTLSYTSSRWTVTTSRTGQYGQRCDEYYYYAAEGDYAETLYYYANQVTYAFLAHFFFKPMIAEDPNKGYTYGPQTMTFTRNENQFFCSTWGKDRDTKAFSSEISWVYKNTSSSAPALNREPVNPSEWNKPFDHPTMEKLTEIRKAIKMYKAQ